MAKALWNGQVIAEADKFEEVEGNIYFPPESIKEEFFKPSPTTTICPWKGEAKYYHVQVENKLNQDAAWFYPAPKDAAQNIKNHVAFWKGVQVEK